MASGFVATPPRVADFMVADLFGVDRPTRDTRVLLPGLGTGRLYDAIKRYCTPGKGWVPEFDYPPPACVGVEIDDTLVSEFRTRHPTPTSPVDDHADADADAQPTPGAAPALTIHEADFLLDPPAGPFDHVVANPPYVRYRSIDPDRRDAYRERVTVATGQFDLYYCFFEQALRLLRPGGTLTFLTPIRYLTLGNAAALRSRLRQHHVGHVYLMPEGIFDETVTTVITSLRKATPPFSTTRLWLESLYGYEFRALFPDHDEATLDEQWATYTDRFSRHHHHVRAHERRCHDRGASPDGGHGHSAPEEHQTGLQCWSASDH